MESRAPSPSLLLIDRSDIACGVIPRRRAVFRCEVDKIDYDHWNPLHAKAIKCLKAERAAPRPSAKRSCSARAQTTPAWPGRDLGLASGDATVVWHQRTADSNLLQSIALQSIARMRVLLVVISMDRGAANDAPRAANVAGLLRDAPIDSLATRPQPHDELHPVL